MILNRPEFRGSYWITDDRDAQEYAQFQGITTLDTADLLAEGVIENCCGTSEALRLLRRMQQEGRNVRIPRDLGQR